MKTLICDCNKTMPLDTAALAKALPPEAADGLQTLHTTLCRREAGAFQRAAKGGDDLVVACTQESRLFLQLNAETEGAPSVEERPIRFVNIRETGGWSKDARAAMPKIAALLAAAQLPPPEPVPTVTYRSAGRVLVIGAADAAQRAAEMLCDKCEVSLLLTRPGGSLPQQRDLPAHQGSVQSIAGWLGRFEVTWTSGNPIDLDLCTRCNACIDVCPEGAIDFSYQVDLARCRTHRDCVRACEAAGAIDFSRAPQELTETFDAVLDLGATPVLQMHQPPQGYFRPGADERKLVAAVLELRELVGEFEKPKFFHYKQKLCAHSRNERVGCDACIEVCSARAIRSDATGTGGVVVEPHLCVGCGACTTVCPSGALTYATPSPDHLGRRVRTLLSTYRRAGGVEATGPAALLVHSQGAGQRLLHELGRAARVDREVRGVPARVLPVDVFHTASVGLDLWMAAFAYGAGDLWVLLTDEEAPGYREALQEQAAVANALMEGFGFAGGRVRLVEARDARDLAALDAALGAPAVPIAVPPAAFAVQGDKRATLELALDHLLEHAPAQAEAIALPAAGSPFGAVIVDRDKCTLCLACVGACPEAALADNPDRPQLRFIERNCVQCGLCAGTCPERAITLQPRLWLADGGKARKQARVVNEAEPYRCIRCGKPFGTLKAIEAMVGKLAGHAMFQGAAAERLKMCGDCRVIDIHTRSDELRITDLR
ncbi:MAG TPA: 4Fe-4S dicluster domain-containing protein [Albitalea sp.]